MIHLFAFTNSGSTVLLNLFLELGLPIASEGASPSCIESIFPLWFPLPPQQSEVCGPRIQLVHRLGAVSMSGPAILLMREPMENLQAEWHRCGEDVPFDQFLAEPLYQHEPSHTGQFGEIGFNEWLLFHWNVQAHAANLCVIHLDDFRRDPESLTDKLLHHIGVTREAKQIDRALDRVLLRTPELMAEAVAAARPALLQGEWRAVRYPVATPELPLPERTAMEEKPSLWESYLIERQRELIGEANAPLKELEYSPLRSIRASEMAQKLGQERTAVQLLAEVGDVSFGIAVELAEQAKRLQSWSNYRRAVKMAKRSCRTSRERERLAKLRRWERDPFRVLRARLKRHRNRHAQSL